MSESRPFEFAVVGLGLIGGSLVRHLRGTFRHSNTIVFDTDPKTRQSARQEGVTVVQSLADLVGKAQLIAICTPPGEVAGAVSYLLKEDPDVIVCDTASTKCQIIEAVQSRVSKEEMARFFPCHPLAGAEGEGWHNSREELLQNAVWVLTPIGENILPAKPLFALLDVFSSQLLVLDPVLHDRLVAYSSHLPQILASLISSCRAKDADSLPELVSGSGLCDLTRLAESSPTMWAEILGQNQENVTRALSDFQLMLAELQVAVETNDSGGIKKMLSQGRENRLSLMVSKERCDDATWHKVRVDTPTFTPLRNVSEEGFLLRHVQVGPPTCFEVGVSEGKHGDFLSLTDRLDLTPWTG